MNSFFLKKKRGKKRKNIPLPPASTISMRCYSLIITSKVKADEEIWPSDQQGLLKVTLVSSNLICQMLNVRSYVGQA